MSSIFDKQRLKASQLRTVADRRFSDAQYLADSGNNKHANGAMYLGGFVIECLLKAKLLEKHRWLRGRVDLNMLSEDDREIHALCYRMHDLEGIVSRLPELTFEETIIGPTSRQARLLAKICGQWTVYARYSTRSADISDAR